MCPLNTVMLLNIKMHQTMFPEYGDTAMGEAKDQEALDVPDDDLRRVIVDAQRGCESEREKLKFDRMLEDHKKGLYPNCEDGNTKLGTTLELLQWKAEKGLSDTRDLRSY